MRMLTLLSIALVLVAGAAWAGETTTAPAAPAAAAPAAPAAKATTHEVQAEIVSVDVEKSTITIKTEKGQATAPAEGKAVASLKDLKPGQKVTLVCLDDEKGAHKSVTEIKEPAVEKASAPAATTK